jgi:hypothetical protein
VAIVSELHLGDVTLSNVTARLDTSSSAGTTHARQNVVIGLDVLRRLTPALDPTTQTITLRRGQISPTTPGTRSPMLLDEHGLRFIVDGHWETGSSAFAAKLLGTQRWTLDAKHGVLVLQ